jgi:hypothetical protein
MPRNYKGAKAMAVNLSADPTLLKMMEIEEAQQDTSTRPYLGMSSMGECCDRKLWNSFRRVKLPKFGAKTLYNFQDGHYSEELTAQRLKRIPGIKLITHTSSGEQIGFTDHGGHFRGHEDGEITGIEQAPNKPHVWEHKCVSGKVFNRFESLKEKLDSGDVLENWNFKYYIQAQLYMHYSKRDRHYLTVALAGSREYAAVRTRANKTMAKNQIERAKDIIVSDSPAIKISESPQNFECKYCDYSGLCHGTEKPLISCRTCIHSFAVTEGSGGRWYCEKFKTFITPADENKECNSHLIIPNLISNIAEFSSANCEAETITYINRATGEEFTNGKGLDHFTSEEILRTPNNMLGDSVVNDLKETFNAKIEGA